MTDRTMKFLLALIALGIWGLLLRPLFAPIAVQAAPTTSSAPVFPAIAFGNGQGSMYIVENYALYIVDPDGDIRKKVPLR